MKAKELRIGNYILHEPTIDDWEEIIVTLHSLLQIDISPESYCGIPLTEEWLIKFGFEKPAHTWCGDKFHLTNYDRDNSLWCVAMNKNNAIIANIRYVHQLQNLYFALIGEELTLKEKQDA